MSTPNNKTGFTLIETLIALVILTMAIVPALYLANSAANVGFNVRDDLIASGLSQEGIEVVRAIRDTNWFNGLAFDDGLADGTYRLEWDSTSLLPLSTNPPLDVDDGLYNYSSGTASPFSRSITITKVTAGELKVVSTVTWKTRTNDAKTVSTEDYLFDWK